MTDLTLDALVEDVARAMSRECCDGCEAGGYIEPCNPNLCSCRRYARAALAAVAKAAGGAYVLHGTADAVKWTVYNQGDQHGCPKLRVAALLRTLAEAARDE